MAAVKQKRLTTEVKDKKRAKPFEQPSSPVQEEPEPVSCVLQGDEIQALAIKLEDLAKLRTAHLAQEEKEKPSVTKKFIVRRSRPQEHGKKAHFLVAYPALSDESKKTLNYPGLEGPVIDNYGYILPHSILGTLQEFKQEALRRGHSQTARLVPDESQLMSAVPVFGKYREKYEREKKMAQTHSSQHMALQNWHRNMALRRKQQKKLCDYLQKSESELLMNFSENYRRIQEQRTLIERSLPALYFGKGFHVGSEFWTQPVHIGDELTGLTVTLGQTECGFPEEVTHVGKPRSIWMEMGTRPPKYLPFHHAWEKSLFLKHRRNELKEILEKLDFYNPDLDGLEVIGRNQPFTSVSAERISPCDADKGIVEEGEIQDPLEAYPDVFLEPVLGPSLKFCGEPARWINTTSHVGEVGIAARVTFEILVGEKAESVLTVNNDGTAAIWYDWRRLPHPFTFQEKKEKRTPHFYFNTRSGVILPGETRRFSFIFKSLNAGIFRESWEFGTHPMLLGGAALQVTLWGVALYEDISAKIRKELERELEDQEIAFIVEENLKDLLNRIHTPERVRSPLDAYVTEEELFYRKNPELHYHHQVVRGLHELWNRLMNPAPVTESYAFEGLMKSTGSDSSPAKSVADLPKSPEDTKNAYSTVSGERKSVLEELTVQPSSIEVEVVTQVEDMIRVEWNLSICDFKQTVLTVPEEDEREAALAQLNKAALELCAKPMIPQADLQYQIWCVVDGTYFLSFWFVQPLKLSDSLTKQDLKPFQLWREVIDGLVSRSLGLRSLLGMPEKDTHVEVIPEETVEVKPVVVKQGKEDRKVQKEEKKTAPREKEKGKAVKEQERPNSKKSKLKEDRKTRSIAKESKEATLVSVEVIEIEPQELQQEQVDPILQEKYHEKLYVEVYGLLNSMVDKMVFLFEGLKKDAPEKKNIVAFV
ncbi:MYCBP-associated protein [Varanus komodoensis]|uniref:MYCBP-associated protein n=1 Tax=Varanus komodoensis TaxID=61221 RepID=UPI001CF77F9F|nr:MYCBP-associated protein [Varanus komodoensis]